MVKKTIILLVSYFFFKFYLTSLRGKEYFAKEPEPGVFGPLEPEPLEKKKIQEPEPLGKKNQELEPLEKKSKEPEPIKNLPAPEPCIVGINLVSMTKKWTRFKWDKRALCRQMSE